MIGNERGEKYNRQQFFKGFSLVSVEICLKNCLLMLYFQL